MCVCVSFVVGWGGDAVAAAGRLYAFPVVWMSSSMVFHGSSSPTGRGHPLLLLWLLLDGSVK